MVYQPNNLTIKDADGNLQYPYGKPNMKGVPPTYALDLDGVDDYIETISYFPEKSTNELTISIRLYPNTSSSAQTIVSHHKDGDYGYEPWLGNDGNIIIRTSPDGSTWNDTNTGISYSTSSWFHFLLRINSSVRELYIDNSLVWSDSNGGINYPTNKKLGLGARLLQDLYDINLDGMIDDFHLLDRHVSDSEKDTLYNNKYKALGDEVAWYPMNEGEGSTVYDESDNSNDGTIYGASWVEL